MDDVTALSALTSRTSLISFILSRWGSGFQCLWEAPACPQNIAILYHGTKVFFQMVKAVKMLLKDGGIVNGENDGSQGELLRYRHEGTDWYREFCFPLHDRPENLF